MLVAGRARGAQELVVEHADAALALDRLEDDRGGALVDGAGDRLGVGATATKPGTSGANGACLASCGVADSAPYVRPWKPRCTETIVPPGLALRASFSAASSASVPELAKWTLPPSERRRPAAGRARMPGSV